MKKTVTLDLIGLDGNAFSLMGAFQKQARREGWSKEEIDSVITECTSGDYDHLLATLLDHCEPTDDFDYDGMIMKLKKKMSGDTN
jgi:hypothetical protein